MRVLRAPRLPSRAAVRRDHERELRDLILQVEHLQARVESEWLEIDEDYPEGAAEACARMNRAAQLLGNAAWLLRGAKRVLP